MKKFLGLLSLLFTTSLVHCQNSTISEEVVFTDDYSVATNTFKDNWVISGGVSAGIYFGDLDNKISFTERLGAGMNLNVTKWFSPDIGIRLGYSRQKMKGATNRETLGDGTFSKGNDTFYNQKFSLSHYHAEGMLSLTDMIGGYRYNRFYSCVFYAGFGVAQGVFDNSDSKYSLSINAGLLHRFCLNEWIDLNLDVNGMIFDNTIDGEEISGIFIESAASVSLGISVKLPYSGWYRPVTRKIVHKISMDEIDRMQKELIRMQQKQDDYKQQVYDSISTQLAAEFRYEPPVIEKNVVKLAPYLILFEQGKTSLRSQDKVILGFVADIMKQADETVCFVITGYADADGDAANDQLNKQISLKRAESVKDCLAKEFGIKGTCLITEGKIGNADMQYSDPALSRAVIIHQVDAK